MKSLSPFLLLGLVLFPFAAQAEDAVIGAACSTLGVSQMSVDQTTIAVCLKETATGSNLVWKSMAGSSGGFTGSYANVTPNRAVGTTYTNTSSKARFVLVEFYANANTNGSLGIDGYVNGVLVTSQARQANTSWYGQLNIAFIVPPGATYMVTRYIGEGGGWWRNFTWYELE